MRKVVILFLFSNICVFGLPYAKVKLTKDMLVKNIELETKCEDGDMDSCYGVAKAYEPLNTERSIMLHMRACNLGEARSCWQLGKIYREGINIPRDFQYSFEYYKLSCEKGLGEGCFEIGKVYYYGIAIARSLNKAMKYYEIACGYGHFRSCSNVVFMYNNKIAPVQDLGEHKYKMDGMPTTFEEDPNEELFPNYFNWIDEQNNEDY